MDLDNKPESCIYELIAELSDTAALKTLKTGRTLHFIQYDQPIVFMIHSGKVEAYRGVDNYFISNVSAPMIIGANIFVDMNHDFSMKALADTEYSILYRSELIALLDRKNLWKKMSIAQMYMTSIFADKYFNMTALPTYERIKNVLQELMNENLRESINASDYIVKKTKLSKSRVMSILKDLKDGNYIEINRGVLNKINKLPEKY